jgi:hypothetical protein|nr:MAG TPA: excisionase [Caudoviricetes sp.]
METPISDGLLSPKDLERILSTGKNQVDQLLRSGVIPSIKFGSVRKIRIFALNDALKSAEENNINLLEEAKKRLAR